MKLNEMRTLSSGDLAKEVQARKRELMELRFQGALGQLANPAKVRKLRREVAQLMTVNGQARQGK